MGAVIQLPLNDHAPGNKAAAKYLRQAADQVAPIKEPAEHE